MVRSPSPFKAHTQQVTATRKAGPIPCCPGRAASRFSPAADQATDRVGVGQKILTCLVTQVCFPLLQPFCSRNAAKSVVLIPQQLQYFMLEVERQAESLGRYFFG